MKRFHKTGVLLAAAGGLVLAAAGAALLLSGREQQEDETMAKKDHDPRPRVAHRAGSPDSGRRVGVGPPSRDGEPALWGRSVCPCRQPGALGGLWPGTTESRRARSRPEKQEGLYRAGLFVDVQAKNGWIYRYLHLGSVRVEENEPLRAGDARHREPAGQAGSNTPRPICILRSASDWNRELRRYGTRSIRCGCSRSSKGWFDMADAEEIADKVLAAIGGIGGAIVGVAGGGDGAPKATKRGVDAIRDIVADATGRNDRKRAEAKEGDRADRELETAPCLRGAQAEARRRTS